MITLSVVLAAGAASVGLAAPAALASVNGIDGGIDMIAACAAQYPYVAGVTAKLSAPNVYAWYCSSPSGINVGGIDVQQQCVAQYGQGAYALYSDYNNAYSWYCLS
jgi:hypothetical protein